MKLHELKASAGARKAVTRKGRGAGSGNGKTAGFGHKGQKARSGVKKAGFEGGQMPLQRRLPKRGFNNIFATKYVTIKVSDLEKFEAGATVDTKALLNAGIKGKSLYRTLYFLPSVTMSAAVAMVWKWVFNEQMGILNSFIKKLGGTGHNWLTDPHTALYMIMIVGLWMSVGYNMIILLAGIQGISKSYYEAAAIDGATAIDQFFHITMPMLTPSIFFVTITSIIGGFQVFDTIYMMIGKTNPAYDSVQTIAMLFYRNAFDYGYKGYAAAISILIFAAIMVVTIIQMDGQKKWVNYD